MKTRAGYWIGGGLMVAAVLGAVLWVVLSGKSLLSTIGDFERVAVPGEWTVQLEAKKYVVYFETPDSAPSTPQISFELVDKASGEPVPTRPYLADLTYTAGGVSGSAQRTVTPPRAGAYLARTKTDAKRDDLAIVFGESIATPLVRTVLGAFAIGAVLGLSGIAMLATTIVRRHRMRSGR